MKKSHSGYVFKEFLKFWLFAAIVSFLAIYGAYKAASDLFGSNITRVAPASNQDAVVSRPSAASGMVAAEDYNALVSSFQVAVDIAKKAHGRLEKLGRLYISVSCALLMLYLYYLIIMGQLIIRRDISVERRRDMSVELRTIAVSMALLVGPTALVCFYNGDFWPGFFMLAIALSLPLGNSAMKALQQS